MRLSRGIMLYHHEQPSKAAWNAASDLCAAWNAQATPVLTQHLEFMWVGSFDEAEKDEFDAFVGQLDGLTARFGVVYHTAVRTHLEESDYAQAEFIQILGVGLDSETRPFLLNEVEALGAPEPCPECGSQSIFDIPQVASYHINKTLLDADAVNQQLQDKAGWDLVNLPNGQLLVSYRFCEVLEDMGARGYKLMTVTSGTPPRPSERMFQFIAERIVLMPCLDHTRILGQPPCPICGVARGTRETYFWVRSDWIGKDEIVSNVRTGTSLIYVSRRLYDAINSAGLNGIYRNEVMRVCHHVPCSDDI